MAHGARGPGPAPCPDSLGGECSEWLDPRVCAGLFVASFVFCLASAWFAFWVWAHGMAKRGEPLDIEVKLPIDEIPLISSTDDQVKPEDFLDGAWCDPRLAAGLNAGEEERAYANEGTIDY